MVRWRVAKSRVRPVVTGGDSRAGRVRPLDVLWAVIIVLASFIRFGNPPWSYAERAVMWVGVAVVATAVLARAASTRVMVALAIIAGAVFVMTGYAAPVSVTLAYLLIFSTLGAARELRWRIVGAIGVVLGAAFAALWCLRIIWPQRHEPFDMPWSAVGFLATAASTICLVGYLIGLVRRQRLSATELRIARNEQHWADQLLEQERERSRLAREMHDVVAHSLAVIVMQAQGARYIQDTDPERTSAALETIGDVARDALADVRILLGQLRGDDPGSSVSAVAGKPDDGQLDELVSQLAESGYGVSFDGAVAPPVPRWAEMSVARRALPELLINAAKHGDPSQPIRVARVDADGVVRLSVSNAIARAGAPNFPRGGHGLTGLRESLAEVGATIESSGSHGVWTATVTAPGPGTAPIEGEVPS